MRLETDSGSLKSALRAMRGIVERRNSIPVLGMVKLAGGRMTGTNLDIEVSVSLPQVGRQEGEAAIDFFALAGLSRHIDDDETLEIGDDDGAAGLSFNGSSYRMSSVPAGDFPDFGDVDGPATRCGNLGLVAALRRVRFAISTEETRYYLNGAAFVTNPSGRSYIAATNGHMLAMMPIDALPDGAGGKILPHQLVRWLCQSGVEPELVSFDAAKARCRLDLPGGLVVRAKTIDGTFPDVFRVVPTDVAPAFSVDRLALLRVLRRIRAFVGRDRVAVKLSVGGGDVTVTCGERREGRTAREHLKVAGEPAKPWEAGFNADLLAQVVSTLSGELVTFRTSEKPAGSPNIISSENDPLMLVLMPMRV